jgi:hypothetical protein
MVYPALLPLIRTPRLPVVDWSDAPRRFKWTRPFRRKTKSVFCAYAITFQFAFTRWSKAWLTFCYCQVKGLRFLLANRPGVLCSLWECSLRRENESLAVPVLEIVRKVDLMCIVVGGEGALWDMPVGGKKCVTSPSWRTRQETDDAYAGVRVSTELELCLHGTSDAVSNFCLSDGRSLHTAFLRPCTKTSFRCINRVAWVFAIEFCV